MIFATATDESTLYVFASTAEAIAYCEGVDVEDGGWRFWDEAGNALRAEFLSPTHRGRLTVGSGTYRLVPAPDGPALATALPHIRHIDGNPRFATLSDVTDHLASAASVAKDHGVG